MTDLPETYHEYTWKLLGSLPKGYNRVDLVADTYREISIKNGERQKRGTSSRLHINSAHSKLPRDFTNFLKNGENKTRLIDLICEVISSESVWALHLLKCNEIYFSKEIQSTVIDAEGLRDFDRLKSNQEEADTKMILHCLDALVDPESTVVLRSHSGDTDIMVLAVTLIRSNCERLFIDWGCGKNRKAICLSDITMSEREKDALLGFHSFSGNDYISAFFMKGKAVSWKCMLKKEIFVEVFSAFGRTFEFDQSQLLLLEEYVCQLYGYQSQNLDSNKVQTIQQEGHRRQEST